MHDDTSTLHAVVVVVHAGSLALTAAARPRICKADALKCWSHSQSRIEEVATLATCTYVLHSVFHVR